MLYTALLAVFALLNAADCFLTIRGLEGSTKIKEKNPVANFYIKLFGLRAGLTLLKVTGAAIFLLISYDTPAWVYFFVIANAGYGYLVYRNYNVLKRNGIDL